MPKFNVEVSHGLGQQQARDRLSKFLEVLRSKFEDQVSNFEGAWDGDILNFGFSTFGIKVSGGLTVMEDTVAIEGDLPFSAMMFKGKIESSIEAELEKLLK